MKKLAIFTLTMLSILFATTTSDKINVTITPDKSDINCSTNITYTIDITNISSNMIDVFFVEFEHGEGYTYNYCFPDYNYCVDDGYQNGNTIQFEATNLPPGGSYSPRVTLGANCINSTSCADVECNITVYTVSGSTDYDSHTKPTNLDPDPVEKSHSVLQIPNIIFTENITSGGNGSYTYTVYFENTSTDAIANNVHLAFTFPNGCAYDPTTLPFLTTPNNSNLIGHPAINGSNKFIFYDLNNLAYGPLINTISPDDENSLVFNFETPSPITTSDILIEMYYHDYCGNEHHIGEPTVNVSEISSFSSITATVNGIVNPNGYATSYYFQYGTDKSNLNQSTSSQNIGNGIADVDVSANLTALTPDVIYYYQVVAENKAGTDISSIQSFCTNSISIVENLVLHLRGDLGITESGNAVSDWYDISNNNNHASQSTSSSQPILTANAMNSQTALTFDGSSSYMQLPTPSEIGILSSDYEVFIVAQTAINTTQFTIAGGFENFEFHINGSSDARFIPIASNYLDLDANSDDLSGFFTDNNPHIFHGLASDDGGFVSVDGQVGEIFTNNLRSSDNDNILIGKRANDSYFLNGDFAEILIYNCELTDAVRSEINDELSNRYSIPVYDHPTVTLSNHTSLQPTSVILNGVVNPHRMMTTYNFVYGTDFYNLDQSTPIEAILGDSDDVNVMATLSGLTSGSVYYYKLIATNSYGTQTSDFRSFYYDESVPKTNLKLHLKADKGVLTTQSNTLLSKWIDLSNNNNHATYDSDNDWDSRRPDYFTSTSQSSQYLLPTLRFESHCFLDGTAFSDLDILGNNYEMYIIAQTNMSDQTQYYSNVAQVYGLLGGKSAIDNFTYLLNDNSGANFTPIADHTVSIGSASEYGDNAIHIFSVRGGENGTTIRLDGIDGGTDPDNTTLSTNDSLVIGYHEVQNESMTYYFDYTGNIYEILLYNTNLSSEDRLSVEQYLVDKYQLTDVSLPVELVNFSGEHTNSHITLQWETASEINNKGFEVQRKQKDETAFRTIAFIEGSSNSSSTQKYIYRDKKANKSASYNYRLKQLDYDGSFEYSQEITIEMEVPEKLVVNQNNPNPFNSQTQIKFELPKSMDVEVTIYSITGKKINTLTNRQFTTGYHSVIWNGCDYNGHDVASGVYFYQVIAGNDCIVRKLILTK